MSSVIDDYEPLEVIGNGSFGVIRKVRRRSDGMLFARKELNFERMTDRDRKQIVAEVYVFPDIDCSTGGADGVHIYSLWQKYIEGFKARKHSSLHKPRMGDYFYVYLLLGALNIFG